METINSMGSMGKKTLAENFHFAEAEVNILVYKVAMTQRAAIYINRDATSLALIQFSICIQENTSVEL